jgi:hypothetical protein
MSDTKRNAGKLMMARLAEIGRTKKKVGTATTVELAEAAGIPVSQAYSRLYWLEARDGVLESVGKGTKRVWRRARKR